MKLTIQTNELKNALSIVRQSVASRTSLPVLENVLISADLKTAEFGNVSFGCTNLDTTLQYTPPLVTCRIDDEGAVTVNAKMLAEIVATLTDIDVDLVLISNSLHITSGRHHSVLPIIAALDFPPLPTIPETPNLRLEAGHMLEIVKRVYYAASVDEARPILQGVNFSGDPNGGLVVSATDGFRVAVFKPSSIAYHREPIIIPTKSLTTAAKLPDAGGVAWYITDDQLIITGTTWTFSTQLIAGNFPDIKSIIPSGYAFSISVDRLALITAVKQAMIMRDLVNFDYVSGSLTVSAAGDDGNTTATIPAELYNGEKMSWALNGKFLMDILTNSTRPEIYLKLNGGDKPVGIEAGGEAWINIVMPMHRG